MTVCPAGNVQLRWEGSHPLSSLLDGHLVYVATKFGGSAHGVLERGPGGCAVAGGRVLEDGDYVFHSERLCAEATGHGAGRELTPVCEPATFWLARLHHARLRLGSVGQRVTGIVCPRCRTPYFADCDPRPDHQTIMEAGARLSAECPDHGGSVTVGRRKR